MSRPMPPRATFLGIAFISLVAATGCNERVLDTHPREPGEQCNFEEQCVEGSTCFAGTCVGEGELRVSLAWERSTDLDLHVVTPSGFEIYYAEPDHSTGSLDVDDCVLVCRDPYGTHVENVFFNENAQQGEYLVWVRNFDGRRSADFEVEVAAEDIDLHFSDDLPAQDGVDSEVWGFVYPAP